VEAGGRFVVQHHVVEPEAHWDLMWQDGPALATWRSPCPLDRVGATPVAFVRIADHRLAYLDYEGPVSGDRGHVRPHEKGTFRWQRRADDEWIVAVEGARTRGTFRLLQTGPAPSDWTLAQLG
jgi:hypothetical protein